MERNKLKEQGTAAALEYSRGNQQQAKQEIAGVVYELLNEAFPEMEKSRQRSQQGEGFVAGLLVGAVLTYVVTHRLLGGNSQSD